MSIFHALSSVILRSAEQLTQELKLRLFLLFLVSMSEEITQFVVGKDSVIHFINEGLNYIISTKLVIQTLRASTKSGRCDFLCFTVIDLHCSSVS